MEFFKSLTDEEKEAQVEAFESAIEQTTCIQKLFAGNDGKLGLKAIDGITGYKNDTFHPDPYQSAYNTGKRAVSIILRNIMDRDIKKAKKEMEKQNETRKL